MSFDICFCFPAGDHHLAYAARFVNTYLANPPSIEHNSIILCDPSNVEQAEELFALMPHVQAVASPDFAHDLSRYQYWAAHSQAECVMFLGGSTYCRRPGWGLRAYTTFKRLGPQNLYGACGNNGAPAVHYHIRTTGFWGSPTLFNRFPHWPKNAGERYEAEHGQKCLTGWVMQQGGQAFEVTFTSENAWPNYNADPQGYARGSQQSLLIGDRLTMPPYTAFP